MRCRAAIGIVGLEEGIDHREAVGEDVGERRGDGFAAARASKAEIEAAQPILDQPVVTWMSSTIMA